MRFPPATNRGIQWPPIQTERLPGRAMRGRGFFRPWRDWADELVVITSPARCSWYGRSPVFKYEMLIFCLTHSYQIG